MQNVTVRLRQRPDGEIDDDSFLIAKEVVPELADGEVQVAIKFISIDPTMRTWMSDVESYIAPVALGDVMRAGAIGIVIASRSDGLHIDDTVLGLMGVQSVYTGPAGRLTRLERNDVPIESYLGGLGGTGLAAFFGLLRVGVLKASDTVVISTAAGAVGHVAVQIAKLKGCRVIGIAGGPAKCQRVIARYGADACIDYKAEDVGGRLRVLCPDGIDLYFDNVGGEVLEAALDNLATGARIVICGAISDYNNLDSVHPPRNYLNLIVKGARMEGLLNIHWVAQYDEARAEMKHWISEGRLCFDQQVEQGIENFPHMLRMQFAGKNIGKLLLRV